MIDPHLIQGMPDEELTAAIQNPNGAVPSWLAMAELHSRNNIRQSAPVAQPQGTVAQSVVGQALRSSGLGQAPSGGIVPNNSPMQAPPSGGGIMGSGPSAPAKMASGGIVRLAGGGTAQPSYDSILEGLGMIPKSTTLTARDVQYNPTVKADVGDLNHAASQVGQLYGKGPDYDSDIRQIDKTSADAKQNFGLGDYITQLVGGITSSKGNAVQGFGDGLLGAAKAERDVKQKNFENQNVAMRSKIAVQGQQDERTSKIASAAERYQQLNSQIAENQDKARFEADRGNANMSATIAHENAQLTQERSKILSESMGHFGNPMFAAAFGNFAKQKGDKAGMQLASDAIGAYNAQKQTESNIAQKREMAVQGARAAASMAEMREKERLSHDYKMKEQSGIPDFDPSNTNQVSDIAKLIAHYKTPGPSPMSLTRPQAASLLRQIKIENPDYDASYYKPIQDAREQSLPNGKIATTATSANTAIAHLDLLGKAGEALHNGDLQMFNQLGNKLATATGQAAPTNFNGIKEQVAGELVGVLKKNGIADQHSIESVKEGMKDVNSPEQLSEYINSQVQILGGKVSTVQEQLKKIPGIDMKDPIFAQNGYDDNAKAVLYHRGFDPENLAEGRVLQNLPGGHGKSIDHDTAVKFLQAAGGDTKRAKRIAYDFGWR